MRLPDDYGLFQLVSHNEHRVLAYKKTNLGAYLMTVEHPQNCIMRLLGTRDIRTYWGFLHWARFDDAREEKERIGKEKNSLLTRLLKEELTQKFRVPKESLERDLSRMIRQGLIEDLRKRKDSDEWVRFVAKEYLKEDPEKLLREVRG